MSEVTAKGFLNLLNQSGIVTQEQLRPVLADLKAKSAGKPVGLRQLMQHLMEAGLVTDWQCQKLCHGRHKGFFLGKYKLLRHLGTGGMSTVYLAQHTIFDQQRAIKVLPKKRVDDKSYLDRFYREGRAAASLNHKNIVRVYDIDHDGETHYLVMEYVDGRDISEMVKEQGPLDFRRCVDFLIQSVSGLQHAHENNIVHRDIKPANLLVTPEGVVKILDLGLALFREDEFSLTVMHNEKVLGTADYLSPEQAVDSHNLDHRADIYSLGCTLHFMLTGKPPFSSGTIAQRIAMHQSVKPQPITATRPDCPARLEQICSKMMEKDPDDRYQSCVELRTIFRNLMEDLLPETQPTTASAPSSHRESRDPTVSASPPTGRASPPAGVAEPVMRNSTQQQDTEKTRITQRSGQKSRPPQTQATAPKKSDSKRILTPAQTRDAASPMRHKQSGELQGAAHGKQPEKLTPKTQDRRSPYRASFNQPTREAGSISVATGSQEPTSVIDPTGLREFSRLHAPKSKTTVRHRTTINKKQLVVAGLVLAMVISLAALMAIAMRLTNRENTKKASLRSPATQQVESNENTRQTPIGMNSLLHAAGRQ